MLDFFSLNADLGYVWLVVGVFWLLVEVGTPGLFVFTSVSIGAFFSAGVAFLGFSFYVQCITSLCVAPIAFFFLRYYVIKPYAKEHKTNSDALVGQEGIVTVPIAPYKVGRVKVGSEEWPAVATQGNAYQKGTVVLVVAVQGNKLLVQ